MFLPGESQEREAWWAAVYGVAQSRTGLKPRSSKHTHNMMGVKGNRIIQVLSKLCAKFADPYRVSNKYTVTHINTFCLLFLIEVLEKARATHSSILAWETASTEEPREAIVYGVTKSQTRLNSCSNID